VDPGDGAGVGAGSHCVIGLGPVGAIVACRLKAAGERVVAVESGEARARSARQDGLRLDGDGEQAASLDAVRDSVADAVADGPFDTVFVCVKANDLPTLVRDLPGLVGPGTTVASLQNGLGIEDHLVPAVGLDRYVRGVVNFAGQSDQPGRVRLTFFQAPNWVGALDGVPDVRARSVADLLTRIGLRSEVPTDIRPYVWRKVVHLAILAPVCALTRMDMRTALSHKELRRLSQGLLSECIAVGDQLGYDCGNGFFETSMRYVLEAGDHPPSMLIDVLRGRPTEVSYINGKVVEAAELLGLDVPLNRAICALVQSMEAGRPHTPHH
jgi:2-dehydropantoate 2-reductase